MAAIISFVPDLITMTQTKSTSDILRRRYGQSTIKRIWKFDEIDYRLGKAELDLEFLLWCIDTNAILNFLKFRVSSQSFKASLTYKYYQLKLFQEQMFHRNTDIKALKKGFKSSHSSVQQEI